jgi:hypothetical protein
VSLAPTAILSIVSAAVPASKSPLASITVLTVGAWYFKPVASELSATNLIQEQSQRIVLGT